MIVVQRLQDDENLWEKYQNKVRQIQDNRQLATNKKITNKKNYKNT